MATPLKIKTSNTTSIPASLNEGEPAYTANGGILFIKANGAIVSISGLRAPGTLTANQAIVVNATSYVDVLKTGNLYIGAFTVNTINAVANSTVLGVAANNELSTTWAIKTYVDGKVAGAAGSPGGSNTFIQFNDSSTFSGTSGLTFDKTTNNFFIGNTVTIGTAVINSTGQWSGNSTVNAVTTVSTETFANSTITSVYGLAGANVGANVQLSSSILSIGNSTVNSVVNSTSFKSGSTTIGSGSITVTDLSVSGNLAVTGTLTTISANNLSVSDSLIKLANGQSTTDVVDIGLYGAYGNSTVAKYTGIFRSASTGNYVLFKESQGEPTTTVNTAATGYAIATLSAYLTSGALASNGTNLNVTANSTLAVALVANTLSLSTALPITSGGTGLAAVVNNTVFTVNSTGGFAGLTSTDGQVLTSVSGVPTFALIDGGTF